MKPMSDEAMSVSSSTDDSAAAAAVFRHLGKKMYNISNQIALKRHILSFHFFITTPTLS